MRYLLIFNPKAGKKDRVLKLGKIKKYFSYRNIELDVCITKQKGDAKKFTLESDHDVIISAGGDGTLNEVICAMMTKEVKQVIGIIPMGTANIVSKHLKLPKTLNGQLNRILDRNTKMIDVGKVNDKYFVTGTGFGFDAYAFSKVNKHLKKIMGKNVYPMEFFKSVFKYKPVEFTIKTKRKEYKGYYILICNIGKYGAFSFSRYARTNDGKLDVIIIKEKDMYKYLNHSLRLLLQKHYKDNKDVEYFQAEELEITSNEDFMLHIDAEVEENLNNAKVSIEKEAVEVLC